MSHKIRYFKFEPEITQRAINHKSLDRSMDSVARVV